MAQGIVAHCVTAEFPQAERPPVKLPSAALPPTWFARRSAERVFRSAGVPLTPAAVPLVPPRSLSVSSCLGGDGLVSVPDLQNCRKPCHLASPPCLFLYLLRSPQWLINPGPEGNALVRTRPKLQNVNRPKWARRLAVTRVSCPSGLPNHLLTLQRVAIFRRRPLVGHLGVNSSGPFSFENGKKQVTQ